MLSFAGVLTNFIKIDEPSGSLGLDGFVLLVDFDRMSSDENKSKVVARIVRCPQCGKSSEYSPRNSFRPFCSERCRLIDLGAWAEGRYAVPAEPQEMTPEEHEKLEAEIARLAGAENGPESSPENRSDDES